MRVLVIGRGRSGTKYVSKVLQSMGLDVKHEADGLDGAVHNEWAIDTSGRPPLDSYTHVWHVVREPLATIASLHTVGWSGPAAELPEVKAVWDNMVDRCAASYFYWNLKCEECLAEALPLGIDRWRFGVEDESWPHIAAGLLRKFYNKAVREVPKDINTRKGTAEHPGKISWDDISPDLRRLVKFMGRAYGYFT